MLTLRTPAGMYAPGNAEVDCTLVVQFEYSPAEREILDRYGLPIDPGHAMQIDVASAHLEVEGTTIHRYSDTRSLNALRSIVQQAIRTSPQDITEEEMACA